GGRGAGWTRDGPGSWSDAQISPRRRSHAIVTATLTARSATPSPTHALALPLPPSIQPKFMPKKPVMNARGGKDERHHREPAGQIGLALGDRGHVVVQDVRPPLAAIAEPMLDVLDLLRVVVQLLGAACIHAGHSFDSYHCVPHGAAVA